MHNYIFMAVATTSFLSVYEYELEREVLWKKNLNPIYLTCQELGQVPFRFKGVQRKQLRT